MKEVKLHNGICICLKIKSGQMQLSVLQMLYIKGKMGLAFEADKE